MRSTLAHGRRLTDDEYEAAIIALQRSLPPVPTDEQDQAARRAELNLAIDHRLGVDFPRERREALWAIQERIEKRRLRLLFWHMLARPLRRGLKNKAQGLASQLVREYSTVLTPAELEGFFGVEEAKNPALPSE